MIHNQISVTIQEATNVLNEISQKLYNKRQTIQHSKTPMDICEKYISLEMKFKITVNKKKKEAERDMDAIKNEYRTLMEDVVKIKELSQLERDYVKQLDSIEYLEQFIKEQTDNVCKIMVEGGFLENLNRDKNYRLTLVGNIASNIAEVHPLPLSKFMAENSYFADFTSKQLIGLFSCFTDIKIPADMRTSIPNTPDTILRNGIQTIMKNYKELESRENELDVRTGIRYENAMIFDMIDFSMQWCDCTSEEECKYFIQNVLSEKEISIGDFTKAMMKIVTVSKELMNICEIVGAIDLLYKLNQIEGMILKYVLTSQSLYV